MKIKSRNIENKYKFDFLFIDFPRMFSFFFHENLMQILKTNNLTWNNADFDSW